MVMTRQLKKSLIAVVYEDTENIWSHILQKTRNMSVKQDNLKASSLNQLNSVS